MMEVYWIYMAVAYSLLFWIPTSIYCIIVVSRMSLWMRVEGELIGSYVVNRYDSEGQPVSKKYYSYQYYIDGKKITGSSTHHIKSKKTVQLFVNPENTQKFYIKGQLRHTLSVITIFWILTTPVMFLGVIFDS